MERSNGRQANALRPVEFIPHFVKWPEGSILAKFGDTHVLCNVTVEDRVPRWLHQSDAKHGWLTAEYALLPRSTDQRVSREQRWPKGRTQEISRLIGRSLRMALDLQKLGQRQLLVDCDVIQADGGTRTAAISGGWVAVHLALKKLVDAGTISDKVFKHQIGAISVGMVDGIPLLDLDFPEDLRADSDLNIVMTSDGEFIEVQGTGEKSPISRDNLDRLLDIAGDGIRELFAIQAMALMKASASAADKA